MSNQAPPVSARILDFAEFRERRMARDVTSSAVRRRFVWSWPATGQVALVDFPAPAAASAPARTRSS